ncbi:MULTISPECIES: DUF2974 domain-containing protein [unclassified Acinetobacter]|uniref:KfrB domain-containing protein n=1 Tax=unclassified Acinetobacter TaxID=196816 RepID=UPI0015D17275|nr:MULTISPECIES: DUF2974 domain-containing protein [unclassified Acinetobacter]UUS62509.1 DUF2974 domain-containing protein [Acinetobacter sp. YH16056_T]
MTSIKDLVDASKNTYQYQAHAKENGVKDYTLFTTAFDEKSNHSGLSYINENTGEVILAHRGTDFTKIKDIVTDLQIALNWKETKADMAAMKFTDSVIDDLIDQGFDIKKVIQTGHSLGGRLAQHCLKNLKETSDYKAESITFNSARVSKHDTKDNEYDHLNLRAKGKGFLSTDLVTSYGSHLGNTIDIELPEVKNFVQAHRLTTFDLMDIHYQKAFSEIPITDLINLSKESNDFSLLQPNVFSNVDKLNNVLDIDLNSKNNAIVISGELGKNYIGEIIAETPKEYIQQLGENSRFFALHDKNNLQNSLNIGDKVQIKYPKDANKKASIEDGSKSNMKSKTR